MTMNVFDSQRAVRRRGTNAALGLLLQVVLVTTGCNGGRGQVTSATSSLAWSTQDVVFPLTWVGGVRSLTLSATNTGRAPATITVSIEGPFSVEPTEATVAGGSDASFTLHFAPTQPGSFVTALVGATGVTLHAEGAAALDCALQECRNERFDPLQGLCIETVSADGAACQPPYACFVDGQCLHGQCVGSAQNKCDDGNPCTTDVCAASGCLHLDATLDCPWSTNPCEAPVCTPAVGCGVVAVPDGTDCGARDCSTAQVCINGACVQRGAPQTQGCTELVYGKPNSCTIADGTGADARVMAYGRQAGYGLTVAAGGTAYFTNGGSIRAVTGNTARTIAGAPYEYGHVDGFGSNARFEGPSDLVIDAAGHLLVADAHTIRRVSPGGLVDTLAGAPGIFEQRDGVGEQAHFGFVNGMALGPDGALYVTDGAYDFSFPDGGTALAPRPSVRRVTPYGEVSTIWVGPEGIVVNDLVWLDGALRAVGGTSSSFVLPTSFAGLLNLETDGGVTVLTEACSEYTGRVEARADGVLCAGNSELRQTHPDGGFDTLMSFFTIVGVGGSRAVSVGPDGTVWTLAQSAGCGLWRLTDGGAQSVVGSDELQQRYLEPSMVIQGPAARPWFIPNNGNNNSVVEVLPDAGASPIAWAMGGAGGFQGLAAQNGHIYASDGLGNVSDLVAAPDGGSLFCQCPVSGRVVVTGETAVCADPFTGLGTCSTDGGSALLFARATTTSDGPPGVGTIGRNLTGLALAEGGGVLLASGTNLRKVDVAWNLSTLAKLDGGSMKAVARVGPTIYVADSDNRNSNLVRSYSGGQFTTVAELADPIMDLTAEDGGTLLVVVPGAIVRVRP
jgi:hypothetical protein